MRKFDNSDWMARKMDRELRRLERAITALYFNARKEVKGKFSKFMAAFEPQNEEMRKKLAAGEITAEQYQEWARLKILKKAAYTELIKSLTKTLVNTDVAAMAAVRGYLPYVIANSFNFVQSLGWKYADDSGFSVGTFQIYNANAVQALIKDNPRLLPAVDLPLDQKWNMDKINHEITQGIIQGKPMDEIATGLQNVTGMDETAAMRTARTAFTYAENMGRDESFKALKAKGIPVKKRWSAILDERTRDTHRLLNGTYANEQGLFGEGILSVLLRCPADPQGAPEEIYNCRCREGIVFDNSVIDHSKDDEAYEEFLKKNYPDDYEKLKSKDYFNIHSSKSQANSRQKEIENTNAKWLNNLNVKEKASINNYSDSSATINRILRGQRTRYKPETAEYQQALRDIKNIDDAIKKYENHNEVAFRGVSANHAPELKIGNIFTEKGYTSSSLSEKVVDDNYYDEIKYMILLPDGKGIGAYIGGLAEYNEDEFLIARNSKFKIVDIIKSDSGKRKTIVIQWLGIDEM